MMRKTYIYPKLFVLLSYGTFLLFPIVFLLFLAKDGTPKNINDLLADLIIIVPALIVFFSVCIWLFVIGRIEISIDGEGLTYRSPFRKIIVKWEDISRINRKYFYSGAFPRGGPPRDLEIMTKSKKRIKIFYFVQSKDGAEDGIEELESEISKHFVIQADARTGTNHD